MTAAVQIQDYHGNRNPYNHTPQDTYEFINQNYFIEQIRATVAIAYRLAVPVPISGPGRAFLPLIFEP